MITESKLDISDVHMSLVNGVYDTNGEREKQLYADNWVFDEDKSVKWNREKLVKENDKIKAYNEEVKNNRTTGVEGFRKDLQEVISNELGFNQEQASIIYRNAWEEGHSGGFVEVINYVIDTISLFKEVNKAKSN